MSPMPAAGSIKQDPLRIEICKDPEDLARHAAGLFVSLAGRALGSRGSFNVALSGGSTPRAAYALLPLPHYTHQVVWPAVHVFWSDERCVPPDHADSNYRMAHEAMLSKVDLPSPNVHRMRGEDADPVKAAADYEKDLLDHFKGDVRFDLLMLGMGADGHTASLFPDSRLLAEAGNGANDRRLVAVADRPDGRRGLTLTLAAINAARVVMVVVSGSEKSDVVKEVLGADGGARRLPITMVRPKDGQFIWLLDDAASSTLDPPAKAS